MAFLEHNFGIFPEYIWAVSHVGADLGKRAPKSLLANVFGHLNEFQQEHILSLSSTTLNFSHNVGCCLNRMCAHGYLKFWSDLNAWDPISKRFVAPLGIS